MFSIITFRQRWDLLLDKVNAPYFTNEEFSDFTNMAMLSYINSHLTGVKSNAEDNDKIEEDFAPLIEEVQLLSNEKGEVFESDLALALGQDAIYKLNVAVKKSCGDLFFCRFVRHNDYYKIVKNSWKKPTENQPIYRTFDDRIVVYPIAERKIKVTALKEPDTVVYDNVNPANNVDLPFNENASMKILQIALQLAGYATSDAELYQLANAEEQKLG